MSPRLPSLASVTDSLFSPTLNMQALWPPILHGVIREGRRPLSATGSGLLRPQVGTASPPKRNSIVKPQLATYKVGDGRRRLFRRQPSVRSKEIYRCLENPSKTRSDSNYYCFGERDQIGSCSLTDLLLVSKPFEFLPRLRNELLVAPPRLQQGVPLCFNSYTNTR